MKTSKERENIIESKENENEKEENSVTAKSEEIKEEEIIISKEK